MNDMSSTIVAKSDQINAADLIGNARTITIKEVRIKAGDDQPVSVLIEGDNKAFRPCKGVRRLMVRVWGPDASKYIGHSMTLFCDPSVTWAGKEEGGIRVSHMTGLDEQIIEYMRTSRAATKPYKIMPLVLEKQSDKAAEWTAGFIDQLGEGVDVAALETKYAKTIDKLKTQRPELYAKVRKAIDALATVDDDPFAEAPDDTQRGEPHVFDADQIIAFINAKVTVIDVNSLVASHTDAIEAFSEEDRDRVRIAQMDRIEELKGSAE